LAEEPSAELDGTRPPVRSVISFSRPPRPDIVRPFAKDPERQPTDHVSLNIECVTDRCARRQNSLRRLSGLESAHLWLAPSDWKMWVLGAVFRRKRPGRCTPSLRSARSADPYDASLSVTMLSGSTGWLRSICFNSFSAARMSRRVWATMSRTSRSSSTACHRKASGNLGKCGGVVNGDDW